MFTVQGLLQQQRAALLRELRGLAMRSSTPAVTQARFASDGATPERTERPNRDERSNRDAGSRDAGSRDAGSRDKREGKNYTAAKNTYKAKGNVSTLLGEITNPAQLRARGIEVVEKEQIDDTQLYFALLNTSSNDLTCSPAGKSEMARFFWRKALANPTFAPKEMHFSAVLKSMVDNNQRVAIPTFLAEIEKAKVTMTPTLQELICRAHATYGDVAAIRSTISTMPTGPRGSEIPYVALIEAYGKNKDFAGAMGVLGELAAAKIQPGARVYIALLEVCSEIGDSATAMTLLAKMKAADFKPKNRCFNALIRTFAREGDMARVKDAIYSREVVGMNRTSPAMEYEFLTAALNGDTAGMTKVIKELRTSDKNLDQQVIVCTLDVLKDRKDAQNTIAMFRTLLDNNCFIPQFVPLLVFETLTACGNAVDARRLFTDLTLSKKWQRDYAVYTEVIRSLSLSSFNERETRTRVRSLTQQMREDKIGLNGATFNAIAEVWSTRTPTRGTDPKEVEASIENMKQAGFAPNLDSWYYLVRASAHSTHPDKIERAEALLHRMGEAGFRQTMPFYLLRVEMYADAGDIAKANDVIMELQDGKSTPVASVDVYTPLLRYHATHGNKDAALELVESLHKNGVKLTPALLQPLFEHAASAEDAVAMLNYMTDKGVQPDESVFNALFKLYGSLNDKDSLEVLLQMSKSSRISREASAAILLGAAAKPSGAVRAALDIVEKYGEPADYPVWQSFVAARKAAGVVDTLEDTCYFIKTMNKSSSRGFLPASVYETLVPLEHMQKHMPALAACFQDSNPTAAANFTTALFHAASELPVGQVLDLCTSFAASGVMTPQVAVSRLLHHYLSMESSKAAENAVAVMEHLNAMGEDLSQFSSVARLMIHVPDHKAMKLLEMMCKNKIPMGVWSSNPLGQKLFKVFSKETKDVVGAVQKACAAKGIELPQDIRNELLLFSLQAGHVTDLNAVKDIAMNEERARSIAMHLAVTAPSFAFAVKFLASHVPLANQRDSFQCALVSKAKEANRVTDKEIVQLLREGLLSRSAYMMTLLLRAHQRDPEVTAYLKENVADFVSDRECALALIPFYAFNNMKDETRSLYAALRADKDPKRSSVMRAYRGAITGEAKWGNLEMATELLNEALSKDVTFNSGDVLSMLFALSSIPNGLDGAGKLIQAAEASNKGIPTSLKNAFISYFQKKKDLASAQKWFDAVIASGEAQGSFTYSPMIAALCDAGEVPRAIELYNSMKAKTADGGKEAGEGIGSFVQAAIIKACIQHKQHEGLLQPFLDNLMRGDKSTRTAAYRNLMAAYVESNQPERAIALIPQAEASDMPSEQVSTFLVRALLAKGLAHHALEALQKMSIVGVKSMIDVMRVLAAKGDAAAIEQVIEQVKGSEGNLSAFELSAIHSERFRAFVNAGQGEAKAEALLDSMLKDVSLSPEVVERLTKVWVAKELPVEKLQKLFTDRGIAF